MTDKDLGEQLAALRQEIAALRAINEPKQAQETSEEGGAGSEPILETVRDWAGWAERQAKVHPLASMAFCLGAGIFFGRLSKV